jgi:hypothetical protein
MKPLFAAKALALALMLGACALPPPGPPLAQEAQLAIAPKSGEIGYDAHACGGDHGMLEQLSDQDRGRVRLGPPEMSICP